MRYKKNQNKKYSISGKSEKRKKDKYYKEYGLNEEDRIVWNK